MDNCLQRDTDMSLCSKHSPRHSEGNYSTSSSPQAEAPQVERSSQFVRYKTVQPA